jgi:hypothetical protein
MRQISSRFAALAACALLFPVLALAQVNSVRLPVQAPEQELEQSPPAKAPVRLEFKGKPGKAPDPASLNPASDDEPRPTKFPNIDTAKKRQDYDLSTPGADGIRLGRDEDTGDTVMGSTPPKKRRQPDPYATTPIEVRPILPVLR